MNIDSKRIMKDQSRQEYKQNNLSVNPQPNRRRMGSVIILLIIGNISNDRAQEKDYGSVR